MVAITCRFHVITDEFTILQDTHDNCTTAVSTSMLRKVVTSREFLAALVTFEWLVVGVERAVVSLEVFLASEATVADITDERL